VFAHPPKTQDRAGQLLVVEQCLLTVVQSAQRSYIRGADAKFVADFAPQGDRHHPKGIQQTSTHAQKTDIKRKTELVSVTPARIDDLTLHTIKGENAFISK
jgi:hypothetical protein